MLENVFQGEHAIEFASQYGGDVGQWEAAFWRFDETLAPKTVLNGHGVRFLEEQPCQGLKLGPQHAGGLVVIGRHSLINLDKADGR
jgi:hypothetical protein